MNATKQTEQLYDEVEVIMEGETSVEVITVNSGIHRIIELSEEQVEKPRKDKTKSWLYYLL